MDDSSLLTFGNMSITNPPTTPRPSLLTLPLELKYHIFSELFDMNETVMTIHARGKSPSRLAIMRAHPQLFHDLAGMFGLIDTLVFSSIGDLFDFCRRPRGCLYRGPRFLNIKRLIVDVPGYQIDRLNDVQWVMYLASSVTQFSQCTEVFLRIDIPKLDFTKAERALKEVFWASGAVVSVIVRPADSLEEYLARRQKYGMAELEYWDHIAILIYMTRLIQENTTGYKRLVLEGLCGTYPNYESIAGERKNVFRRQVQREMCG